MSRLSLYFCAFSYFYQCNTGDHEFLNEQCFEIFTSDFHGSSLAPDNPFSAIKNFFHIGKDMRYSRCTAGVNDTGVHGNIFSKISKIYIDRADTGNKFTTGVFFRRLILPLAPTTPVVNLRLGKDLQYGVRYPKFIWAPCAQVSSLAETLQLPPLPPAFKLIYESAVGQPR
jgi:hypothetical protein